MATLAELIVRVGADMSDFNREIAGVERKLERSLGSGAMDLSRGLVVGLAGVTAGLGAVGVAGVKMAADMEQSEIAFTTMLGSADKAKSFLADLSAFAAGTPFELPGLISSSRKLLAFGFDAQEVIPMMTSLGDAVAGLGGGEAEINRVTMALGQMQAKGKVSAEEMMQLAELGIPAWDMLAKKMGITVPEAMKLSEKGAISAQQAIDALTTGMSERFGGMMEKQSTTLTGLWSTLKDNAGAALRSVGEDLVTTFDLKTKLAGTVQWLGDFAKLVGEEGVRGALAKMIPEELQASIVIVAGALAGAMAPALLTVATNAWAALAPLLPWIAAGAALAAVAYLIYDNWDVLANWFQSTFPGVAEGLAQVWAGLKETLLAVWQVISDMARSIWDGLQDFWASWGATITAVLEGVWEQIRLNIELVFGVISGIVKTVLAVIRGDWEGAWDAIRGIGETAWSWLTGTIQNLAHTWSKIWDSIAGKVSAVWEGIKATIRAGVNGVIGAINRFISAWNSISIRVPSVEIPLVGTVGGFSMGLPNIPQIPMLAEGGIVRGPTLAMIGERGPEAVVPLDRYGAGGSMTIVIQLDGRTVARQVVPFIPGELVRMGVR